jgi:hypothetical protein
MVLNEINSNVKALTEKRSFFEIYYRYPSHYWFSPRLKAIVKKVQYLV